MGDSTTAQLRGDVYHLGYRWVIDGPIDVVYHFVSHGRTYPEWFPVFRDAQSDDDEVRIGARVRYHVKALLPYHLYWDVTLTRLEPPHLVETDTTVSLGNLAAARRLGAFPPDRARWPRRSDQRAGDAGGAVAAGPAAGARGSGFCLQSRSGDGGRRARFAARGERRGGGA